VKEENISVVKGNIEDCLRLLKILDDCEECYFVEEKEQIKDLLGRTLEILEGDEILGEESYYKDSSKN